MLSRLEELQAQLGTGWWSFLHYLILIFALALPACHALGGAFLAPSLDYFCIPSLSVASEDEDPITPKTPSTFQFHSNDSSECTILVENTKTGFQRKEFCSEWRFDNSTFITTATSDFQLACDRSYLVATYTSIYMSGMFFGSFLCGFASDRYGRKTVLAFGMLTYVALAIISCWVPNFSALLFFRFLLGFLAPFFVSVAYISVVEISEPRLRSFLGITSSLPWAFATMIWAGLAYLIRRWRWLQFAASIPGILVIPLLWYMDESPRWLAVTGRHDQALKVLKRTARWNRAVLPPDDQVLDILTDSLNKEEQVKNKIEKQNLKAKLRDAFDGMVVLFRTPKLCKITITLYTSYLIVNMVYYGLSLSGGNLSDDPFIFMVLSGLMEVPGYSLTFPIVDRFGRKIPTIVSFMLSGVVLIAIAPTPSSYGGLIMSLALIGKVTITAAYQILIFFSTELFPTEVRSRGLGTCIMMSRIGSIISPFINEMLGPDYPWAPATVFGVISIIACVMVMMLPETLGVALPDTVAQLEQRPDKSNKRFWIPVSTSEEPATKN